MAEEFLLERWRTELKLNPFLKKAQMPQGGYTETVELGKIDLGAEWRLMKKFVRSIPVESLPVLTPRNRKIEKTRRDWRAERLKIAMADMQSSGFEPLVDFPGVSEPWKSRCKTCKAIVTPRLTNVRRGHGCKVCSKVKVGNR
jgi:hypothetical protein